MSLDSLTRKTLGGISFLMLCHLSAYSQPELYGSWQGKMQSANGSKYVFNLDILSASSDGHGYIKGVAIHDRNGEKEVIELRGVIYGDQSVYLSDVLDRYSAVNQGKRVSKLQFLFKYDGADPTLDGHWQEYRDLRSYRKGRLVLRKKKRKA